MNQDSVVVVVHDIIVLSVDHCGDAVLLISFPEPDIIQKHNVLWTVP